MRCSNTFPDWGRQISCDEGPLMACQPTSHTCACRCLLTPLESSLAQARVARKCRQLINTRAVAVAVCRARVVAAAAVELYAALEIAGIDRAVAAGAIAAKGSSRCAGLVLACCASAARDRDASVDVCSSQEQEKQQTRLDEMSAYCRTRTHTGMLSLPTCDSPAHVCKHADPSRP